MPEDWTLEEVQEDSLGARKPKPQPQSQCHAGGRRGADEVGVSERDPAFDEL